LTGFLYALSLELAVGAVQLHIGGFFEGLSDGQVVGLGETLTLVGIIQLRLEDLHDMSITLFSSKTKASLAYSSLIFPLASSNS
jgi:hypothetical protein